MSILWLCITSALTVASVFSDEDIDIRIQVFPAQSIAGVVQVTSLNHLLQPQYAFNASEARMICSSVGLNIATRAQVDEALARGLETCRFGWIDEHFAVIPRIQALPNCGQNQTGLVPWRAAVTRKFDAFCFNESDAAAQLKDAATDNPLNSSSNPENAPSNPTDSDLSVNSTASSDSTDDTVDSEGQLARLSGSAQGSTRGKVVLITCTGALLLTAVIIFAYLKTRRYCSLRSDMGQQQESGQL
ncbi:lymphatic vessel endothelial hyaluronic acid receptor 1a [Stegastes partitus]|uniref:Lymphatic vessel endothelial hyaluronan receptor 1 n=1 Tax=Stegastes partitus TaxID=144197 RepID=A0A3B5AF08_9TELE|nr:PREDICTED: lymphatic vessel endothelial hyaluronic acid receptor 1 [Stegastes partitus]